MCLNNGSTYCFGAWGIVAVASFLLFLQVLQEILPNPLKVALYVNIWKSGSKTNTYIGSESPTLSSTAIKMVLIKISPIINFTQSNFTSVSNSKQLANTCMNKFAFPFQAKKNLHWKCWWPDIPE